MKTTTSRIARITCCGILLLCISSCMLFLSGMSESHATSKPLSKVKFTVVKTQADTVTLKWKKQKCTGYEVYRSTGAKWKKIKRVTAPRFTEQKLVQGTYKYKVRAYRNHKYKGKSKKKYGKFSKIARLNVTGPDEGEQAPSVLAGTTVHFFTPVNVHLPATGPGPLDPNEREIDYDPSVLMLPDSYTDSAEPTRLVIWCHGAGKAVTLDSSQAEDHVIPQYLVANGYAVMDVNGLPPDFAQKNEIYISDNVGSPIAIQSYVRAYQYVTENYNICKDGVFVGGASMGGISGTNLVMSGQLPVIAHGALCPVLDTYNEIWKHPWNYGTPKAALATLYKFPKVAWQTLYMESKVKGYNPVNNNTTTIDGVKYTEYPCPVTFWHCDDDPTVDAEVTKAFVQQIKNAGGEAYMRSLPYGGHAPDEVGEVLSDPSGNTNYRGKQLEIKPVTEEVLLWFNSFNM